ncbi:hypothetical protein C3Y87_01470 [Carbonactinospora thermoautotrophica]|uniref:hypothetical protein n=1 Tax=Carbonactinospora thermoautotrophica TaxID=1469144 RepID=UPI002270FFB6|nr:hypothetical protein [Carbonactinospora thermoautotrophica]MCX9190100.1 hypothetical protein [Carbonactinospora thermoautotrophica]
MKRTLITTGRAVVLTAALLGLTAACTTEGTTNTGSGQSGQIQQDQNQGPAQGDKSADCAKFKQAFDTVGLKAIGEPAELKQALDQARADLAAVSDPQVRENFGKFLDFYQQVYEYKVNGGENPMSDSSKALERAKLYTSVCVQG